MPLVEGGFITDDGHPNKEMLIAYGPTLEVAVGQPQSKDGSLPKEMIPVHGLVDTGAIESCIDDGLARSLGLPQVDVRKISGASGESEHDVYLATVNIPDLKFSQYGAFTGVKLEDGGQQHRVLLGRTFLENTIMIYDGLRAQVTFASALP